MGAITLDSTYRVRPDIFIKTGNGRLYIRHGDGHFVLKTPRNVLELLLAFLDSLDGTAPLADVLARFPVPLHGRLTDLLGVLTDRGAAFALSEGPLPPVLAAAADVLTYLSDYTSEPAGRFQRFLDQTILVRGDGYALIGFLKTLFRLGARRVWIERCGTSSGFAPADFAACAAQTSCWERQELHFVDASRVAGQHFDHVVTLNDPARDAIPPPLPVAMKSNTWYANLSDGLLVLTRRKVDRAQTRASLDSEHLTGGAAVGLACFDHLTGIRELECEAYCYYDLRGTSRARRGRLTRLVSAVSAGVQSTGDPIARLGGDLGTPLFPVQETIESTGASGSLKIGRYALSGHGDVITVCGFDREQCRDAFLHSLRHSHQLWLEGYPGLALSSVGARDREVRASQDGSLPEVQTGSAALDPSVPTTARAEYVAFCIHGLFGVPVRLSRVARAEGGLKDHVMAEAGAAKVTMPHIGPFDAAESERLVLSLLACLYAERHGGSAARTIFPRALPEPDGVAA